MADPNDKNTGNVPGAWYTDSECIGCNMCDDIAPRFFKPGDEGFNIVHTQPVTEEEIQQATEALEECPVEAIGNDGA